MTVGKSAAADSFPAGVNATGGANVINEEAALDREPPERVPGGPAFRGRIPRIAPFSMTTVFSSPDELLGAVGQHLGVSEWIAIEQDRIDQFAEATGDHQWIHVDPVAAADGPFGATIAHGYLTLALTNQLLPEIMQVESVSMGINYGTNKVRFPQPVTVGSRVRATASITEAEEIKGGVQVVVTIAVEIEDQAKPACVVESVSRFLR